VSALRRAIGIVGELLITAGVIVLLFVAYQLVWTNFLADRVATQKADQLEESWEENGPEGPEFELPISNGDAFAVLRIPGISGAERVPIVQGVTLDDLARGVGHYPDTALPGEVGNFSVAGHRATNGEPFAFLDQLHEGDPIVVETGSTWYTYEVTREYIVQPTQVGVISPVPNQPEAEPTRKLLTLTTCNPRWASYERLIFHARLVDESPKGDGRPSALGGDL
jgi:sortase A